MAVRSHFRFVAGVCVVAAGLLMGGGAVAVADPGLSGSAAHGDNGTNASGQPSTGAKKPKDEPGGAKKPNRSSRVLPPLQPASPTKSTGPSLCAKEVNSIGKQHL